MRKKWQKQHTKRKMLFQMLMQFHLTIYLIMFNQFSEILEALSEKNSYRKTITLNWKLFHSRCVSSEISPGLYEIIDVLFVTVEIWKKTCSVLYVLFEVTMQVKSKKNFKFRWHFFSYCTIIFNTNLSYFSSSSKSEGKFVKKFYRRHISSKKKKDFIETPILKGNRKTIGFTSISCKPPGCIFCRETETIHLKK